MSTASIPSSATPAMSAALLRKITRKLIPFLVIIYLVAYIDRSNVGIAKLSMQGDIGLSNAAYGLGAGLFFIGYFFFEVPSNLAIVRFGPRRWFARIMITWGVILMLTFLTQNDWSFYMFRFLLGAAEAGLMPGLIYYLANWFPFQHRARMIGLLMFGNPIAVIVGAPLSAWILDSTHGFLNLAGWQWMFILTGLPAVVLAFVLLAYLPDSPATAKWLSDEERSAVLASVAGSNAGTTEHGNPLKALKDKRVLFLSAFWLAFPVATLGLQLWLPTIVSNFESSKTLTGFITAIPYVFVILALWYWPRRSQRKGELYWHMALPALLGAVAFMLVGTTHNPFLQMGFITVAAVGLMAGQPILLSLPTKVLSASTLAVGIACVNSIGNLGGFIGPFAVGMITDATGSVLPAMYFLAAWLVYAAGMALVAKRVLGDRSPQELPAAVGVTVSPRGSTATSNSESR
ncbi:MFS transporter [Specibacter cremeus]|uniref:MFS transporter n=1 Tax=Specibacter cremeus TaxID=1629051 RepID=UPI000F7B5444|nr:MFS transporter [Specibacter cremeus]